MGKIFKKRLDKEEDKKDGLLKRLKNIEGKNEELPNAFSATNKVSKAPKNERNYNYDSKYAFYEFDFKNILKMSLDSKYVEMIDFYKILNSFINVHVAITAEAKDRKDRILSYVKPFYEKYFGAYKKNYDNKKLTDEEKRKYDHKQFEMIDNRDQGPKSAKEEETKTKKKF